MAERGAERPVDVRLAPTGAERRPTAMVSMLSKFAIQKKLLNK